MEPPWEVGKKVYINGTGHMTKMATMLIYGKNLQKSNRPRYQVSVYRTIGPLVIIYGYREAHVMNGCTCHLLWVSPAAQMSSKNLTQDQMRFAYICAI